MNLELISGSSHLPIEAQDGQATIMCAGEYFRYIDPDFKKWGLDRPGKQTSETLLSVYEITADSMFTRIFANLNTSWPELVLTQSQIIWFCRKYPAQLSGDIQPTFFLMMDYREYFVVSVRRYWSYLHIGVFRARYNFIWLGKLKPRVVIPSF